MENASSSLVGLQVENTVVNLHNHSCFFERTPYFMHLRPVQHTQPWSNKNTVMHMYIVVRIHMTKRRRRRTTTTTSEALHKV